MAKKPTITTVQSGFNSQEVINENFQALADALDNTLSLDGSIPNAMEADLDLNGQAILNVGAVYVDGTEILASIYLANQSASAASVAASASATAAAVSAANALSSEEAAELDATAAETAATAAAGSATSAASSASAAATSEINAATSATSAASSATDAATSETNAASSATSAANSASAAATSATNAATSETNAAGSATAAAASQVAAAASAASAANSYDLFDDRYLGSKTSDPTLDNDGNALVAGALYFNSTANEMRVYDGANWIAASSAGGASLLNYNFTATAGQTTFSGADDNAATLSYTQQNLIVTLNGIVLEDGTDYTASNGTSIVLTTAAAAGDELNIVAFKSFTTADMVPASTGGTFSGNVTATKFLTTANKIETSIFRVNAQSLTADTTIDADENASAAGPLTVASGVTLTVSGNLAIV